ncbi:hypothetical protein ANCCAN_23674 [Ancylostoma caninum]|uniref:Uncharacterized protein n=1 Tax=Ancylostoma caninum TaxID=29170 RepID=A0A368FK66_ANCCA|nr:hypothetical protein ANCCAN_23674 [Ancylostoma caninum]
MISMGYTEYDIEWTIQNNILRVTVKPKSLNGVVTPVQPIDTMLCVNADVLEVMDIVSKRTKRNAAKMKGIDFKCVDPKFNCQGFHCSVCTDVDISPASEIAVDKFYNCLPSGGIMSVLL